MNAIVIASDLNLLVVNLCDATISASFGNYKTKNRRFATFYQNFLLVALCKYGTYVNKWSSCPECIVCNGQQLRCIVIVVLISCGSLSH